ncbi:gluconokinase [Corynebacterium uterequi]|nr:gluconokinase [Corynebacterium uterequi]
MAELTKVPTMSIPLKEATGPFVLALDIGSTASRGGLYDATGCPVKGSKQRLSHAFVSDYDGTSAIDADQVVAECREIIAAIVDFAAKKNVRIDAVAMDTFAASLVLVDASGNALTRAITYADSRCADYVTALRERVDEAAYHARTGVRLHTSYHPARLAWLAAEYPELLARTKRIMSIGEYVYFKLAGIVGVATSTAAWSGVLNVHTGEIDKEILDAVGVSASLFAPVFGPQTPTHPERTPWPALNGTPWLHAIPDGWPSNVGPGAVDASTVAVAAATSGAARVILPQVPENVPAGLWCYRLDAQQAILGGALNDVGRAISWLETTLAPVDPAELGERLAGPPDEDVPAVLPFFTGERATGWAADAKATITDITEETTVLDMWHGVIESIAISYARIFEQLSDAGMAAERVIASGRVTTEHPEWLQVLANVTGATVIPLAMKRATLRGTALIALEVINPGGTRAVPPFGEPFSPRADAAEHYARLRRRFDELYSTLVDVKASAD